MACCLCAYQDTGALRSSHPVTAPQVAWCRIIAQFSQGGFLADNVEVQLGGAAEEAEANFGFFFCCTPPPRPTSGVQNEDWGITEMWGRTFGFGDSPGPPSRVRSPTSSSRRSL